MDFKDLIKQISERIPTLKDSIQTEEATKNAFIMPFIQALGYDVFNPLEVVPEMTCDFAKKGERIDYAILKDGEPVILIECKVWNDDLAQYDKQLARYFGASKAKFGVLTNGIIYKFYTDLDDKNVMDKTPFLTIDMENLKDSQIEELKKFHKSYFDIDTILGTASELKYMQQFKAVIKDEFNNPSPEFVKLIARKVYDGMITSSILEQFTSLIKRSLNNYVNDVMSDKLNIAINNVSDNKPASSPELASENDTEDNKLSNGYKDRIVTTEDELNGYYIVKSILREHFPVERITYRDTISYFGILADDNNRKPICRLYFNSPTNKQIVFVDENRKETRHKIASLDEIFCYSEELINAIQKYIEPTK